MKYHFFWGGIYSNWYKAPFVMHVNNKDIEFNCAEQYMMYLKAHLSNDIESMKLVMKTKNPREQKALGRKVKNFNSSHWDKVKYNLMLLGLIEKFKQNTDLKEQLLREDCDLFVEASPYDRIWGIGYNEEDALSNIDNWGENILGILITNVRKNLKTKFPSS